MLSILINRVLSKTFNTSQKTIQKTRVWEEFFKGDPKLVQIFKRDFKESAISSKCLQIFKIFKASHTKL